MDLMTRARSQWDRLLATATALAGVLVLIIGWYGVSGTPYPAEQLPYLISGGVGALFLLGVSATLWLSADLRDEWRKLDRIEHAIRDSPWQGDEEPAAPDDQPTTRLDRQNGGRTAPEKAAVGERP